MLGFGDQLCLRSQQDRQTDTSLGINSCGIGGISPMRLPAWWHTPNGVRTAAGNAGASGIVGQGSGGWHLAAEQGGRMWLGETLVSPVALASFLP